VPRTVGGRFPPVRIGSWQQIDKVVRAACTPCAAWFPRPRDRQRVLLTHTGIFGENGRRPIPTRMSNPGKTALLNRAELLGPSRSPGRRQARSPCTARRDGRILSWDRAWVTSNFMLIDTFHGPPEPGAGGRRRADRCLAGGNGAATDRTRKAGAGGEYGPERRAPYARIRRTIPSFRRAASAFEILQGSFRRASRILILETSQCVLNAAENPNQAVPYH